MTDTYRTQVPPHLRSLPEQTLDALLRIEEMLGMIASALHDKGPLAEEEKPAGRRSRK